MALTGKDSSTRARELLAGVPVIAVLEIERVEDAAPLARALIAGGLPILEVTLRTPVALDAIAQMKTIKNAVVGAGDGFCAQKMLSLPARLVPILPCRLGRLGQLIDACETEKIAVAGGYRHPVRGDGDVGTGL